MTVDDMAEQHEQLFREVALRNRRPEGPQPTGYCYNCEEPLAPELRFCDGECREDYERRQTRGVK